MGMNYFVVLAAARLLAALRAPIQDSDEVYNFLEPTHFLTHGWGLQTWEWSPEYAIRSWAYVLPHALIIKAASLFVGAGPNCFWAFRIVLALIEAWTEYKLVRAISRRFGSLTSWVFVVLSASATGMFHASISYLPSTFAMYSMTLALTQFLATQGRSLAKYCALIAVGGIIGWPFALFCALPWLLFYTFAIRSSLRVYVSSALRAGTIGLLILAGVTAIDSAIYHRFVVVPFNIVAYNVFNASENSGPDIFGTEPWHYYLQNLALNFNAIFALALLAPLVLSFAQDVTTLAAITPLYCWMLLFSMTPHKEERFIYVVYPFICVAASLTLTRVWSWLKIPRSLLYIAVAGIAGLSICRSAALAVYYHAPFDLYSGTPPGSTVCVGREWYRFPSSYFLSEGSTLKFIPNGFDGLLPATEFTAPPEVPSGMNNLNIPEPSRITNDWQHECDFIVELDIPVNPEVGEISPAQYGWPEDKCSQFLDTDNSSRLSRLLYFGVNGSPLGNPQWVSYCRYQNPRVNGEIVQ